MTPMTQLSKVSKWLGHDTISMPVGEVLKSTNRWIESPRIGQCLKQTRTYD
jgi:hypothetical protein